MIECQAPCLVINIQAVFNKCYLFPHGSGFKCFKSVFLAFNLNSTLKLQERDFND